MLVGPEKAARVVAELFDSSYPGFVRYALWAARSLEVAEDAVQQALAELYQALCRGERIEDPKGWTIAVIRKRVLKQRRAERRRREDFLPPASLDDFASPGAEAEALLELDELLAALSPREQEVIMLRLQALKYQEIGKQLGISLNSVKTLLRRALNKLRAAAGPGLTAHAPLEQVRDDETPGTLQ